MGLPLLLAFKVSTSSCNNLSSPADKINVSVRIPSSKSNCFGLVRSRQRKIKLLMEKIRLNLLLVFHRLKQDITSSGRVTYSYSMTVNSFRDCIRYKLKLLTFYPCGDCYLFDQFIVSKITSAVNIIAQKSVKNS